MTNEFLPQLHQRVCGYKVDLEAFLRVVSELNVPGELPDVKKKQLEIMAIIKVKFLVLCSYIIQATNYFYINLE